MTNPLYQNIIKDLGLDTLSAKEQEEVLLKIGKIIFQSILIKVMEELDDNEIDNFTELLEKKPNDEKAILDYLQAKIPNFNEFVNNEVANFKKESVDFMKAIKKQI